MDTTIADEPAIATSTPSTWRERIAGRLADATRLANWIRERTESPSTGDDGDENPSPPVIADGAGETTVRDPQHPAHGGPSPSESLALDRWWVLVAPLVGGVVLSSVSLAFDPNPLRTGTSPSGLLAFAVLVPFFILCVAGTLALFRDAARLRTAGADWSPNPWHYVVPSALLLVAFHAYLVVRRTGRIDGPVGFLVGSLVVALATSSILAGPAYLFRRRRRLGAE